MNQTGLPSNLVNGAPTITEHSNAIPSSTNTIRSSSSESATSSSTLSKSNAKSVSNPPSRHSERVANSHQNCPIINTTKQPSNLPALPEEDIAAILEFTNEPTPPVNSCKHAHTTQNASGLSPAKKKGRKGKGKASNVPLDVDFVDALIGATPQSIAPPIPPSTLESTLEASLGSLQPLPLDTPPSPPPCTNGTPPPFLLENPSSPSSADGLFTFTQAELEALITEHAQKLLHDSQPSVDAPSCKSFLLPLFPSSPFRANLPFPSFMLALSQLHILHLLNPLPCAGGIHYVPGFSPPQPCAQGLHYILVLTLHLYLASRIIHILRSRWTDHIPLDTITNRACHLATSQLTCNSDHGLTMGSDGRIVSKSGPIDHSKEDKIDISDWYQASRNLVIAICHFLWAAGDNAPSGHDTNEILIIFNCYFMGLQGRLDFKDSFPVYRKYDISLRQRYLHNSNRFNPAVFQQQLYKSIARRHNLQECSALRELLARTSSSSYSSSF
ncbi:hypothetical protein BDZ94DRAFT_1315864 [Collybia nuda]|uniref:Uncharacterized protein n=1 Tax=Collybia nuda TaxID=64659 RepID=A0A9P6C8A4_9AGAR|nr:hypothetical protein BDZ94DRAFT_1315864 [Collybia nuda]